MSANIRRPWQPWEHEPMTLLGEQVRDLRRQAGLSVRQVAEVALLTPRQLERIESAGRRTRRSTLERIVETLLLACPDLGDRDELVRQLVAAAGAALHRSRRMRPRAWRGETARRSASRINGRCTRTCGTDAR